MKKTITIPDELIEDLELIAEQNRLSFSRVISIAIEDYLIKNGMRDTKLPSHLFDKRTTNNKK